MRWTFEPVPRLRAEVLIQRVSLALIVTVAFPFRGFASFTQQPNPNGLGHWIDFTFLSEPALFYPLYAAMLVCAVLYAAGIWLIPALGYLLFFVVACGTLANSQGRSGHATQIVGLLLLAQLLAYAQAAWWKWRQSAEDRPGADDLAVHYSLQMIAAVYVASGISKLIKSNGLWIAQLPNISVQILKTHGQRFVNTLDPAYLERGTRIAEWIAEHPDLVRAVFGSALFLELFAFLGLLNRRAGVLIGAGLWIMHAAIAYTMVLHFSINQWVLLIYMVNLPYTAALAHGKWRSRRQGADPADSPAAG